MTEEDVKRTFESYVKKGVFKPVSRFITGDMEERLAEGIAQAFEMYRQHALNGVELGVPILVVACRRRATDLTRHLVRGQHRITDALEPRAFNQGRVEVLHLDGLPDEDGDFEAGGDQGLGASVFERASNNVNSMTISAISLAEWVETLTSEDVALVTMRLYGYTLAEIAAEIGGSLTRACQRLQRLGEDLARHAQVPVPRRSRRPRGLVPHESSASA